MQVLLKKTSPARSGSPQGAFNHSPRATPMSTKRLRRCPHGKSREGYYCVECIGKGTCWHGHIARKCELCNPGYWCAKHGVRKSRCPHGGPDSSCGKDLCRRHGLQVKKGHLHLHLQRLRWKGNRQGRLEQHLAGPL